MANVQSRSRDMGGDNLAYRHPRSPPDDELELKFMATPEPAHQPRNNGSCDDYIVSEDYFRTLDNTSGGSHKLDPDGASNTQSEIENGGNPLDSPLFFSETLHNDLLTSVPKYITKLEDTFTSTGGVLSAPLESDVRIIVPSGAIPDGRSQSVFFGVFLDETTLLQDVPEAPDTTLISPVIECGPHDIHLLKPVEIIVPHCLDLSKAKKEWITVYRCAQFSVEGISNWERVPNESEKVSQSQAFFTVKEDVIHIKTTTFSLWSILACGGPRRKIATVFASRPDPLSDLIYLRFYVYSDNQDSKRRVELVEEKRFPGSTPAREKPFRMYKDTKKITVRLTDLEEGWIFDKTSDPQIYRYEKARGSGFRSKDACDFAVKPEDGRVVKAFSCEVKFQQEDDDQEHSFSVYPGFTPLKRQNIGGDASTGTSPYKGLVDWDNYVSSLGNEPVTDEHIYEISPNVGRHWKDLLRSLFKKEKVIENLSEDFKYENITEKCIQGLLKWKELDPQSATIKTLATALRQVGCFDALEKLRNYDESNITDSELYIEFGAFEA